MLNKICTLQRVVFKHNHRNNLFDRDYSHHNFNDVCMPYIFGQMNYIDRGLVRLSLRPISIGVSCVLNSQYGCFF